MMAIQALTMVATMSVVKKLDGIVQLELALRYVAIHSLLEQSNVM